MAEHILVPTDGSKSARRAAEQAVELADRDSAVVHALYVASMGDMDYVATPGDISETRDRLVKTGTKYVEEVAEMGATAGIEVVTEVRTGIAEDEIPEYADEQGIDLIVMGKRGRSGPDKALVGIGSTARRVMARTEIPVRVV